jgi:CRP-like cAMP-binding protein
MQDVQLNLFSELPIFANMCEEALTALCGKLKTIIPPPGELVGTDAKNSSLFLVVRGELEVVVRGICVRILTSGDFVGETNVLGIESASWTAIRAKKGKKTCIMCQLTREHLLEVLAGFPEEKQKFDAIRVQHQGNLSHGIMIDTCTLFRNLSAETLVEIEQVACDHLFFPGQTIVQQGVKSDELYMMVKGRSHVARHGDDDRVSVISRRHRALGHQSAKYLSGTQSIETTSTMVINRVKL